MFQVSKKEDTRNKNFTGKSPNNSIKKYVWESLNAMFGKFFMSNRIILNLHKITVILNEQLRKSIQ